MQIKSFKLAQAAAITAVLAGSFSMPASAHWHHHHRHHHHALGYRPLTVGGAVMQPIAPDPYSGPAALITAPVAIVATAVSVPFRAAGALFPATGNPGQNPFILVGAPVHLLGQAVNLPFYVVGNAFGAPPASY